MLSRMPIVRPIYKTMKQIFQTLFSKSESSFRRVGLVEFPSPGMWSLVFSRRRRAPTLPRVCRNGSRLGVHAVHAESDDRIFLLRAAARRHRPRHLGRERHDTLDVGGYRPAGRKRIEALGARRHGAFGERGADRDDCADAYAGEMAQPAPISLIASSLAEQIEQVRSAWPRGVTSVGSRDSTSAASSRAAPDIRREPPVGRCGSPARRSGACRALRPRRAGANLPRRCGSRRRSRAEWRAAPWRVSPSGAL